MVTREPTELYAVPKPVLYVREIVRVSITLFALGIYLFMFYHAIPFAKTLQDYEVLMGIFLPLLTAMVGGALGFLFSRSGS